MIQKFIIAFKPPQQRLLFDTYFRFADQGIEAVGVDVIYMALEQFFTDHSMEWEEAGVPAMGSDAKLLTVSGMLIQPFLPGKKRTPVELFLS